MARITEESASVYESIEADVSFDAERTEQGKEINLDTMQLTDLFMFGKSWNEAQLRAAFGDQGAEALINLIFGRVDW
jgi:hypothetical protein